MAQKITSIKARRHFKERLLLGIFVRRMRLFCDYCDKFVPSDIEWICSYCNEENYRTKIYSFLNKCRSCKRSPKSYACPHCGQLNFLDKDNEGGHPARAAISPLTETPEEIRAKKLQARADHKEELEHELLVTRLNAEVAQLKASVDFLRKKSALEKLEESFSEHDSNIMAAHKIAKRERTLNQERYQDDPELFEKANESLAKWLRDQL